MFSIKGFHKIINHSFTISDAKSTQSNYVCSKAVPSSNNTFAFTIDKVWKVDGSLQNTYKLSLGVSSDTDITLICRSTEYYGAKFMKIDLADINTIDKFKETVKLLIQQYNHTCT